MGALAQGEGLSLPGAGRLSERVAEELIRSGFSVRAGHQPPHSHAGPSAVPSLVATKGRRRLLVLLVPTDVELPPALVAECKTHVEQGYEVSVACADRAVFERFGGLVRQSHLPVRVMYYGRHHQRLPARLRWSRYFRRRGSHLALWFGALALAQIALIITLRACEAAKNYNPAFYEPKDIERETNQDSTKPKK